MSQDMDSIVQVRWSALGKFPVKMEITSYAHCNDLLGILMVGKIKYGSDMVVTTKGPHINLTINNLRCMALQDFCKTLVNDYGCEYMQTIQAFAIS